jgi:hypothetical protein
MKIHEVILRALGSPGIKAAEVIGLSERQMCRDNNMAGCSMGRWGSSPRRVLVQTL